MTLHWCVEFPLLKCQPQALFQSQHEDIVLQPRPQKYLVYEDRSPNLYHEQHTHTHAKLKGITSTEKKTGKVLKVTKRDHV